MTDTLLNHLRDIIQDDPGKRGLHTDPQQNLINAWPDDFALACHSLAGHPQPALAVVTGFFIARATPPGAETDGPLGALYLARALVPLGTSVVLVTDDFCVAALQAGLAECGLQEKVPLVTLPTPVQAQGMSELDYWNYFHDRAGAIPLTHLLAIERVGPNYTHDAIPAEHRDRCHSMRGQDITEYMSPAHRLFEVAQRQGQIITIGIGDGGNEIGMGKIPWQVIERNIPNGRLIACRSAVHHLIVCGVSNWGAYALSAGVSMLRGRTMDADLFDTNREQQILEVMVQRGHLVDAGLAKPNATVDGLTWEQYAGVLTRIGDALRTKAS